MDNTDLAKMVSEAFNILDEWTEKLPSLKTFEERKEYAESKSLTLYELSKMETSPRYFDLPGIWASLCVGHTGYLKKKNLQKLEHRFINAIRNKLLHEGKLIHKDDAPYYGEYYETSDGIYMIERHSDWDLHKKILKT
jgi:hypothetical protein